MLLAAGVFSHYVAVHVFRLRCRRTYFRLFRGNVDLNGWFTAQQHQQCGTNRDGYLWFATWEGVVRYNGINFQLFDCNQQTGMDDSGTRTLLAMENNGLLVAGREEALPKD